MTAYYEKTDNQLPFWQREYTDYIIVDDIDNMPWLAGEEMPWAINEGMPQVGEDEMPQVGEDEMPQVGEDRMQQVGEEGAPQIADGHVVRVINNDPNIVIFEDFDLVGMFDQEHQEVVLIRDEEVVEVTCLLTKRCSKSLTNECFGSSMK